MADDIDIDHIIGVLRQATTGEGGFSQRSLSAKAGQSRDCVGDIINGRNKNPTLSVLRSLAEALGGDLSIFALIPETRTEPPTEVELEVALLDMLPGMPKGALDKRARYLAAALGRALKLPPGSGSSQPTTRQGETEAAPLLPGSTN